MKTLIIGINDEFKFEKIVALFGYLRNFTYLVALHISQLGIYIQIQNANHVILFELNIPNYWFDYYHFKHPTGIVLTLQINAFYQILQNRCPGFVWITYDIAEPTTIIINSEECYYENPYNCEIPPEACYCELRIDDVTGTNSDPLLDLPSNDKYQYHLVIEQKQFRDIIETLMRTNKTTISFHCSSELEEVIIYADRPLAILQNHNTVTLTQDFISTFNVVLLSQLPLNDLQTAVVYIFLNPNMPIKFAFPLDECDDSIDFNINISPNDVYEVCRDNNDFLNMCLAMNNTTL
jgi:hypothetical protein